MSRPLRSQPALQRAKQRARGAARWAARVRYTRAWPAIRPLYLVARRIVDVDQILGRARSRSYWKAHDRVFRTRRRLLSLGFTEPALRELEDLTAPSQDPFLRRLAAWELALWHAGQTDDSSARTALRFASAAAEGEVDPVRLRRIAIVQAECQERLADRAAAAQTIDRALRLSNDPNLHLARANLAGSRPERLALINRALAAYRIGAVQLRDADDLPTFDRLYADAPRTASQDTDSDLVSVIIPAHNAAPTIRTALDSVLAQTWRSIEVLVVDDASTDRTAEIVAEYARQGKPVTLLRTGANRGPYVARNLGLQHATGAFVTCHDADDWSHPEKLERQVRHLRQHRSVIGNTSQQARADDALRFHRRGQPGLYVFRNLSSFMFRRQPVRDAVGYWDSVRFGGDEEFVQRIAAVFGAEAVVDLATGPLCFQRQAPGTLTTDRDFGYHGFLKGARFEYQEAYRHHHLTGGTLRYEFPQLHRPFAVPAPMLPDRPAGGQRRHFDVIIASDYRMLGGSTQSTIEEVKAQRRWGLRTGLFQMSRYAVDPTRTMLPQLRDLVDGDNVQILVHGEHVSCDLLVVRYPPVLQDWQRYLPDVRAREIRVIVNQPPMSDYGPEAVLRYDIPRCAEHLRRYFGRDATWHPIGPLVRRALHDHHSPDLSAITLADTDWVNIIDVDAWRRRARPANRRPIIGRHSRDHVHKWPATAAEILAAYPDSPDYDVYVLGGGDAPQQVLGYWPEGWRVWKFGELTPKEFLAGLDVFVYYTHHDWVESFGRVIIEAMAAGVPVILPYSYRDLFGDAASYAKPAEVGAVVDHLIADPGHYRDQVERAQHYVEDNFGYSQHRRRVAALLRRPIDGPDRPPS